MSQHILGILNAIPHSLHRYDTVGDWQYVDSRDGSTLRFEVKVSEMPDWRYEALVAVHELVEALLCRHRGISEESVTAFDREQLAWVKELNIDPSLAEEPGNHPDAPYRREHFFATSIERLLAAELGVDWAEYEKAIGDL